MLKEAKTVTKFVLPGSRPEGYARWGKSGEPIL